MLELSLHLQVLPEQIHHHGLHVAPNATAVPAGARTPNPALSEAAGTQNKPCHACWGQLLCCSKGSPLHQLHDALGVHEENLALRLAVQGGRVAVQDVGNLKGEKKNKNVEKKAQRKALDGLDNQQRHSRAPADSSKGGSRPASDTKMYTVEKSASSISLAHQASPGCNHSFLRVHWHYKLHCSTCTMQKANKCPQGH